MYLQKCSSIHGARYASVQSPHHWQSLDEAHLAWQAAAAKLQVLDAWAAAAYSVDAAS